MCAVRSSKVVETLPFVEFSHQINVAFVAEKFIELLLIGTVRSFNFAIELRGAPFDVGVPDPEIFDKPMEFGLKFVVIPPFLTGLSRRIHAAVFSFIAGVIPPMAMLGRSWL